MKKMIIPGPAYGTGKFGEDVAGYKVIMHRKFETGLFFGAKRV